MNRPLRIGVFVGTFPVASETFILRQITGLLDLGHDVHIFANARGEDGVTHAAVERYELPRRTTIVDGHVVVDDFALLTGDVSGIVEDARTQAQALAARAF